MNDEAHIIDFAETLARIRKSNTPRANAKSARKVVCRHCGEAFTRGKTQRQYVCPNCSKIRQIESARQRRNREGPLYEKVVIGQYNHWRAEAMRLGIFPDDAA